MANLMARETRNNHRQMTLGGLISAIQSIPGTYTYDGSSCQKTVRFDFAESAPGHVTSWRGSYVEMALTFNDPKSGTYYGYATPSVSDMLVMLTAALNGYFSGWKGGLYRMTSNTPVWVAQWGQSSRTAIIGVRDTGYEIIIDTDWCEY